MSQNIYVMAKKYYTEGLWSRAKIDALHNAGKLTEAEYNDIIGE